MKMISKTKTDWNITRQVHDAIEICRKNHLMMATISVPNTMVRLAAEMMLNEISMYDEAACRVEVAQATVH